MSSFIIKKIKNHIDEFNRECPLRFVPDYEAGKQKMAEQIIAIILKDEQMQKVNKEATNDNKKRSS